MLYDKIMNVEEILKYMSFTRVLQFKFRYIFFGKISNLDIDLNNKLQKNIN